MSHRSVILVGDVTDHGGFVLTGSAAHHYDGRAVARVGDTVSCPTHGNNAIVGGGSTPSLDGRQMAVERMATACGSRLIPSQTMFNTTESRQDSSGRYQPLWNQTSPGQPAYNPHGASPFPGDPALSLQPPDNIP